MLGCPGCGQRLRPWGHACERTVRDTGGTLLTVRPDRALCTGCGATHVVLDAGLLPRRAYAAGLIGQALTAAARGHGHRPIAAGPAVPAGTVRGWIRAARRSAMRLRVTGIRAVLASGHDELLCWARTDELGAALEHLAAAALVLGRRHGLEHTSWWARINVVTRGRLRWRGSGRRRAAGIRPSWRRRGEPARRTPCRSIGPGGPASGAA